MNKLRLQTRLWAMLLVMAFAWSSLAADLQPAPAAQPAEEETPAVVPPEPESPPVLEPGKDNAPAVKPQKKRARHRSLTARSPRNERVEIGKDVVIGAGEVVRELVVIAGNATVDGTVEGNLVVVSGSAHVNGQVHGDLVTILGSATLGPDARIGHDAVVVGGPFKVHHQATVDGQQTVIALGQFVPDFMWLQNWLAKGLFLARPFPPGVRWVWIAAAMFLFLYAALTVIFPRPVLACVETLTAQPAASFFIGVLLFVLLGPLLFLLVVSVAGLLVIPFVFCALVAAAVLGKIAVYSYAGQQLTRPMHAHLTLPAMLMVGAVACYFLYMVPVLGFAVWGMVTLVGLGAVLLAAFSSFRGDRAQAYAGVPSPGFVAPPIATSDEGRMDMPAAPPVVAVTDVALLPRVGFWRRLAATMLDFILLGLLLHATGPLFIVVWVAYHVAMWTWKGTTIGGIVMGIKVVRQDGQPIDFAVALVRGLSSFFSAFALFLGFFWAGWDRERQAWHDKIAGTIIVRVPKGISLI